MYFGWRIPNWYWIRPKCEEGNRTWWWFFQDVLNTQSAPVQVAPFVHISISMSCRPVTMWSVLRITFRNEHKVLWRGNTLVTEVCGAHLGSPQILWHPVVKARCLCETTFAPHFLGLWKLTYWSNFHVKGIILMSTAHLYTQSHSQYWLGIIRSTLTTRDILLYKIPYSGKCWRGF